MEVGREHASAVGSGNQLVGSEPRKCEGCQVRWTVAGERKLGQPLADQRPELEAVSTEAACHDQTRVLIPSVEDEVAHVPFGRVPQRA